MNSVFNERLKALSDNGPADVLWGGLKGIEKESLRVTPAGRLSSEPHPRALGSALTNKYITTDFSEALIEFVTPAFPHTWEALRFLCDIHQFTYSRLEEELLWVTSMPCFIAEESAIPLARYGDSNIGRMKTVYRNGLGYRYGRNMQTIAGVHFNYSIPDAFWPIYHAQERSSHDIGAFRSAQYLGMIRNFRRWGWLVLYLFGASPALCKSFIADGNPGLEEFDAHTLYAPYGTSLRMSDLGYSNKTQASIDISLNDLNEYINDLREAIDKPEPDYEKIGVLVDGEYRQLSANQLQIENEYYSPIRPKRVARTGERPTSALLRGGIEYVEIRSLDLNVFDPVGVNQNVMRFTEAFLVYCLLSDSPPIDEACRKEIIRNHAETAKHGRDPDFRLLRDGAPVKLADWGEELLQGIRSVAELIDRGGSCTDYVQAVDGQFELLRNPEATPSARVLRELHEAGTGFFNYALAAANRHKEYFAELAPLAPERLAMFEEEVSESLRRQEQIEAANQLSFEEYLANYFSS